LKSHMDITYARRNMHCHKIRIPCGDQLVICGQYTCKENCTNALCSFLFSRYSLFGILMNLLQRACVFERWRALCVIPHSGGGSAQGQSSCLTCYWFSCVPCTYSIGVMPRSICYSSLPSKK
jgi:hypothetical protein